jgi:hypothetical protein
MDILPEIHMTATSHMEIHMTLKDLVEIHTTFTVIITDSKPKQYPNMK